MKNRQLAAFSSILAASSSAFALGVRIADQDTAATARGNAFTATADNPSAIYYNPAGITQLEGFNARLGLYAISLGSEYHAPGISLETKNDWQAVPQVYCTYSLKDVPLSIGLGIYAPYGLSNEWPDSSPFRTIAIQGRIKYLTAQPVLAWKACEAFSIAAGPTFNTAETDLRVGALPNAFNPAGGDHYHLHGDDVDIGFTVGAMLKLGEKHSFGVTYRSATEMNFHGHSRITGAPPVPFPPFNLNFNSQASASFQFPQNVIVGYSFRPTPNWNFEVDVDWTDWDSLNTVNIKQPASTIGNTPLVFNWRSSFFYEFGVTRKFNGGWRVSGGYIYSENSVPDKTFNPVLPDSDRHIWSLGVGRDFEHWRWDFAYQLAWGPERNVTGNAPNQFGETANGRYEFLSHALSLSIGYHF